MNINISSPQTGRRKDFAMAHFQSNHKLNFGNNDFVNCNSGVYSCIDSDNKVHYDNESSIKFDTFNRKSSLDKIKKAYNSLYSFRKEIRDNCIQGPILSLGCGTMYFDSKLITELPFVPLDISKFMLQVAVKKGRSKFGIEADGTNLPFGDNQFELTYCIDGLPGPSYGTESQQLREKMLNEMQRVTIRGGRIVLLLPNKNKAIFTNTIKLRPFPQYNYGFSPSRLYDELVGMGFEIDSYAYTMYLCPFRSKELINLWNSLASFFRLNFLGMIFIVIKVP